MGDGGGGGCGECDDGVVGVEELGCGSMLGLLCLGTQLF